MHTFSRLHSRARSLKGTDVLCLYVNAHINIQAVQAHTNTHEHTLAQTHSHLGLPHCVTVSQCPNQQPNQSGKNE